MKNNQLRLRFDPHHDGVTLHPKTYIQPFEQRLASAELCGLLGDPPSESVLDKIAKTEIQIPMRRVGRVLRNRLAYWEWIGNRGESTPSLQVMLEGESGQTPDEWVGTKLHRSRRLRYGPHGLHEYRGKFFPQLVRSLINFASLRLGDLVLDPMCGSGTTNCEARAIGMRTLGMDMNPLSVKLTRVKVGILSVDPKKFVRDLQRVTVEFSDPRPTAAMGEYWDDHDREYLLRWFASEALYEVEGILRSARERLQGITLEFAEVCLSNILREISWQKDSDLRVRKEVHKYVPGTARNLFTKQILEQQRKVLAYLSSSAGVFALRPFWIFQGDSRQIDKQIHRWQSKCDLTITSPPYAMALPYIDTDRLSLVALGLLPRKSHKYIDADMIGNREVTEKQREMLWTQYEDRRKELPDAVRRNIEEIADHNHNDKVGFRRRNLPALLGKYFLDMVDSMRSTRAMMKQGGHCFYIVGNNSTQINGRRFEIETDKFLWEIGGLVGFRQRRMMNMELLPSRDIFRTNRGSAETLLWFEN